VIDVILGGVVGAITTAIPTMLLYRQQASKLAAETGQTNADAEVKRATAADTVTTTVQGLLITMQKHLDGAEAEIQRLREQMRYQQAQCDAEIEALHARITTLETRVTEDP
jgi:hypothetical protein